MNSQFNEWVPSLLTLSDVTPQKVSWRAPNWLPVGKLVVMSGDPGTKKSFLSLAIASAISRGDPIPPGIERYEPQSALLLSAEDGAEDTIVPRLKDMGADLTRLKFLKNFTTQKGDTRLPDLRKDMEAMDDILSKGGDYGLVVIDPLNAYTPDVDSKSDVSVRTLLAPLAALAERHHAMVLVIRHLNKNESGSAIYRTIDSIAYTAAARVALLVAKSQEDEEESLVTVIKNNLAKHPDALAFATPDGVFTWRGQRAITADELLSTSAYDERTAVDEVGEFLLDLIKRNGGSISALNAHSELNAMGFSDRTSRRARAKFRIESTQIAAKWVWRVKQVAKGANQTDGPLGHLAAGDRG